MIETMHWRVCPRFREYEISECGDLRRIAVSKTRKVGDRPRGFIDQDGYRRYIIKSDGERFTEGAHRLVAEAFIGPSPSPNHEVAHSNGSRVSCHYRDLRWALRKENHADMQVHGTAPKGERNPKAKITEQDVREIRAAYRQIKLERGSVPELAASYGLHHSTIIRIAKCLAWRHVA